MNESSTALKPARLRTIYIENDARDYPVTRAVLAKYPGVPRVLIRNYKDVFNRPRQDSRWQAEHPALILAVRSAPFVFPGPEVCQSFGAEAFFYSGMVLNCPFDCEYCFLQGMYPGKYSVAFVNVEDFVDAIRREAARHRSMLLALSYDTDLLAFENQYPYVRVFTEALRDIPGLILEIRTKSAVTSTYKELPPSDRLVFAFSLAPPEIQSRFEHSAASTEARLRAIETAIGAGHRVRLCFDPVFIGVVPDRVYTDFYTKVFTRLPADRILDVSHGFFRMNRSFFKRVAKMRPDSIIYSLDYDITDDVLSFSEKDQSEIRKRHLEVISKYLPKERIFAL
ncbi:MAG: DNA photolyase [Clostridiales bacterium]|nr:DNA photolyase [Clostridiales bacterium]